MAVAVQNVVIVAVPVEADVLLPRVPFVVTQLEPDVNAVAVLMGSFTGCAKTRLLIKSVNTQKHTIGMLWFLLRVECFMDELDGFRIMETT